jgi:putative Ca2+/H+ antiporter (TMEM165/GDT1 family)
MALIAIFIGVLLTLLGLITYFAAVFGWIAAHPSPTALIPCAAGVLLILLGILALRPAMRKHAMHAAAIIGLLGTIAPLGRLIPVAIHNGLIVSAAVVSQILMSLLCAIFLILCVRSFITARRQRRTVSPTS